MRIAISGYGKMGKVIEEIAQARGHEISARIGSDNPYIWEQLSPENTDVVIEFSTPGTVISNIHQCMHRLLPVVVGTTGWSQDLDVIRSLVLQQNQSLLYASNFSIGVNLFFKLNRILAKMMAPFADYAPVIDETHHIHKLDAPSGTGILLANGIIENDLRYQKWSLDKADGIGSLQINAHRVNEVPGTHTVTYDSVIDTIEISHTAKSRKGFAQGAVVAAEWLRGRKGVYTMTDVLELN